MITPDRVEQLLDNEQIRFTRSSSADGEQWQLHIPGLPKTLTLSPGGDHLIIRTGRITKGRLRPGDQPLGSPLSATKPTPLLGHVDNDRRYVVDLHLPGKRGLSQHRFLGALLETSSTYRRVMGAPIASRAPATC